MRQLRRFLNPSLRNLVRGEVCVRGVGVTRSVVVVSWDLSGTAVVHAGGWWVGEMAEVEHGARGWHGINKVPTHVHWAALQIGVGEASVALHAVVFVFGARVALLLRDTAAQRRRVRGQAVHVLLGLGEGRRRGRVVAQAVHVLELARVSGVIGPAQRRASVRGVSHGGVRQPLWLLVLFIFHPPVLKPNLYLTLGEIQQIGHLHPPWTTKVAVKVKLLFQLHKLRAGVSSSDPLGGWSGRAFLITHLPTWGDKSQHLSVVVQHEKQFIWSVKVLRPRHKQRRLKVEQGQGRCHTWRQTGAQNLNINSRLMFPSQQTGMKIFARLLMLS